MRYFSGRLRWLVYAAITFAALFACFIYDTRREPTAERQLRNAGIAVTIQELKARYTSEPKQDNGAFLYFQAMGKIKDLDHAGFVQLPIAGDLIYEYGQVLTREQRDALHAYVVLNHAVIALILEAQKHPFSRFPENRYDSFEEKHLSHSRDLGRLLACAALDAALSGDIDSMDRMIVAGLRLPEVFSEGGLLIDALVANAIRSIAISSAENCLYFITPPKDVLRAWLNILGREQYTTLNMQQDAFRNETTFYNRYFVFDDFFFLEMHPYYWYQLSGIKLAAEWTQYNYFSQNQYIQVMNSIINAADKDFYTAATMSENDILSDDIQRSSRYALNAILLPALTRAYSSLIRNIAQASTIRAALASLLYLDYYGKMPDRLEDLTSGWLPVPPRDPFTPDDILRYHLTDTQAVFYSIGPDEQDNDGKEPEESILQGGDIIFRVPLTKPDNNV